MKPMRKANSTSPLCRLRTNSSQTGTETDESDDIVIEGDGVVIEDDGVVVEGEGGIVGSDEREEPVKPRSKALDIHGGRLVKGARR